jgi:hypothetical protein
MAHLSPFQSMDIDSMMDAVSSIFSELNIGLLIYHLEEEDNPRSLKLLYANRVASTYTGADLSERVGRHIVDAFPALANSHLPEVFSDVAVSLHRRLRIPGGR